MRGKKIIHQIKKTTKIFFFLVWWSYIYSINQLTKSHMEKTPIEKVAEACLNHNPEILDFPNQCGLTGMPYTTKISCCPNCQGESYTRIQASIMAHRSNFSA